MSVALHAVVVTAASLVAVLIPAVVFALSIPVAFLDTTAGLLFWWLTVPAERATRRLWPGAPRDV